MADLTSTSANAFAAGASAVTMQLIGVDHYILLAAFWGAAGGVAFSPRLGLMRTTCVFFVMVFGACMLGPWIADFAWANSFKAQRAVTFLVAAGFQAAFAALLMQIEPLVKSWSKKLGAE